MYQKGPLKSWVSFTTKLSWTPCIVLFFETGRNKIPAAKKEKQNKNFLTQLKHLDFPFQSFCLKPQPLWLKHCRGICKYGFVWTASSSETRNAKPSKVIFNSLSIAKHVLLTSFSQNWVQIWRTYERTFSILAILSQYLLLFLAFVSCSRDSHSGLWCWCLMLMLTN